VWALTLAAAAALGALLTVVGLRIHAAVQERQLQAAISHRDVRWAALVRFGADRVFKGTAGRLLGLNDGTTRFEPSRYDERNGAEALTLGPEDLRWLPGSSRDLLSGVRYRKVEIRVKDARHLAGVFSIVGDPS
jgi:hypothetical protein